MKIQYDTLVGLTGRIKQLTRRLLKRRLDAIIFSETGLIPINDTVEDDVFIVGYPKSGNTWFQHLLSGVMHGIDPEYAPHSLILDLSPDVHMKRYYRRFTSPMFFRSHHLPKPEYRRVVYLLRDGRDVMVSYFHHLSAIEHKNVDFLTMVQSGSKLFPCKWHDHVEAWLSNPYNAEMITIKYEDLKRDAVNELQRFCAFVGAKKDDQNLELMINKASFEKMRQRETHYGWDVLTGWPRDKSFVRRGKVGSYTDEMPSDVLKVFLSQAGNTLRQCGYIKD